MQDKPRDVISAFCDEALALQFAELHAGDLRYVAEWGRWYSGRAPCGSTTAPCLPSTARVVSAAALRCWPPSGESPSRAEHHPLRASPGPLRPTASCRNRPVGPA